MASTIKLDKAILITALKDRLALHEAEVTANEKSQIQYAKDYAKYTKEILSYALAHIKEAENVRFNYRTWQHRCLNIDFDLKVDDERMPKEPERVSCPNILPQHQVDEIKNTIKLLGMTTDTIVPATLYKNVVQYL